MPIGVRVAWVAAVAAAYSSPALALGPPGDPVLSVPPFLVPGEPYTLEASALAPDEKVTFVRGSGLGSGPCPPALGGLCLDLAGAKVLGSAIAGADGVAAYGGTLPASVSPSAVLSVQAVVKRGPGGVDSAKSAVASIDVQPAPVITTVTDHHRYDPGLMFGGWGPHLGHLVRATGSEGAPDTLWVVDDYCAQAGDPGTLCDVNHNHTLGYLEEAADGWQLRDTVSTPGLIQQNTATIVDPATGELHTFGIDSGAGLVYQCSYEPTTGPLGCFALAFSLVANCNYIGAAVSPDGYRMVWWTGVVDGGGGTFHYIVDYGGGWNGPRTGFVGGYNDASYINIAFGGFNPNLFTMHAQLVLGFAPVWDFLGALGYGDLGTADPVTWANALPPPADDAVLSTNDIWIDPATDDGHVVARSESGAAVYYHRPDGGSWSGPQFELPATYRARFVSSDDRLVLIYGPNAGGLAYRIAQEAHRPVGAPIDWASLPEVTIDLPAEIGAVLGIYPESSVYQGTPAQGINVAIVGAAAENVLTHVRIE